MAIHRLDEIVARLTPFYGADCPVAIVARASWPDQVVLRGRLDDIAARFAEKEIARTAIVLVGPALRDDWLRDSALYAADYPRRFRREAP